ncbi:YlbF family regulator [Paraclostridium bifermentans]|uniref:YlbF family regulator n=1 Tax=Paraclostridium bifermentans TaxID=1490 RepID=UPI0018FE240D|nr:YlbF family regulator [Paraclostridium bifermentans]
MTSVVSIATYKEAKERLLLFDEYVKKKNLIYSRYKIEDASKKISQLNRDYDKFFNHPLVSNYMNANRNFNMMMENLYKQIESELTK